MWALRFTLGVQCPVVMCFAYRESVQSASRPLPRGRERARHTISYMPVSSPVLFVCACAPMNPFSSGSVITPPQAAAVTRARPPRQSGPPSPPNWAMGMYYYVVCCYYYY